MTFIKNQTYNVTTASSHRVKGGGRNKYSKGLKHYTTNVAKGMPKDTIPVDYEQPEAPTNSAFGMALQAALTEQNT